VRTRPPSATRSQSSMGRSLALGTEDRALRLRR
jgi:hypothetical protein